MAITKLIRTALDRAVHKELIDTKFVYFLEGLAVVLWSSIKVCTNIKGVVQGSLLQCRKSKSLGYVWQL